MKKNRRNNAKKERAIMIASSAFVLTALTLAGVYMKSNEEEPKDGGYTLDFAQMENDVQDKASEIAENLQVENQRQGNGVGLENIEGDGLAQGSTSDDALDYMPLEVGSGMVEIPGLTGGVGKNLEAIENPANEGMENAPDAEAVSGKAETAKQDEQVQGVSGKKVETEATVDLHFAEADGLLRPINGEVILPFSMDGSVYFSTLDQYKYNPALMIGAEAGVQVVSCADGRVVDIFENEEIGQAVTVELGDGYQITYGQLQNIAVGEGHYVEEGQCIGFLNIPTKYFTLEGSNLYLKLTVDDVPVNPEVLFR